METLEKNQIEISGTLRGFRVNKYGAIDALELSNGQGTIDGQACTIKK